MPRACIARGHTPRKMHLKGEEEWVDRASRYSVGMRTEIPRHHQVEAYRGAVKTGQPYNTIVNRT